MSYSEIFNEENFRYFELSIDKGRDVLNLNILRTKILECLLNVSNVKFQKNINPFMNNILLSGLSDNDRIIINKKDQSDISLFLDNFHCEDFYISCNIHYTKFIVNLFPEISKYINNVENKVFYCRGKNIKKKITNFIMNFIEDFSHKIHYNNNKEEILYSIKLNPLSIPETTYIEPTCYLIKDILKPDYDSNFFSIKNNTDSINLTRIENSELPIYEYYNDNIKCMYIMILSLLKVNMDNNLPTCSPFKILRNLNNINHFESVNFEMAQKIYNFRSLVNFNYEKFDNINDAVAFNIYLNTKNINGLMFNYLNKYHIAYENEKMEIPSDLKIEQYKSEIMDRFGIKGEYSLYKLINAFEHKGELIFEDQDIKLRDDIPLGYFENKGLAMYNLQKHPSGLLSGFTSNDICFDRKFLKITKEVDFYLVENIEYCYTIILNYEGDDMVLIKNFYIEEDEESWITCLIKAWKKGYLLTDYGLQKYISIGNFEKKDIRLPDWVQSKDYESSKWCYNILRNI